MSVDTPSHFNILKQIGSGGMGKIYLAEDTVLDRHVALKFLSVPSTADPVATERFRREAKAAAALNHPNIITVYEVGEDNGQTFIAMEYVEGESLRDKIRAGALSIADILDIALQIGAGLAKAHAAGIVHRDLKPENIVIDTDGRVRILDFGLAKLKGTSQITGPSATLGTLQYMSPEQLESKEVDHRTDIWSLGAICYEMISGNAPFQGDSMAAVIHSILHTDPTPLTRVRADCPPALDTLVAKLLSKNADSRYQQVTALITALRTVAEQADSGRVSVTTRLTLRLKRIWNPTPWKAVLAGLIVLISGFIAWQQGQPDDPPWLRNEASLGRLISERGHQRGILAPDGSSVAYEDGDGNIKVKILETGETHTIAAADSLPLAHPAWSPDSRQILFLATHLSTLCIHDLRGRPVHRFPTGAAVYSPAWSGDGRFIAYVMQIGFDLFLVVRSVDGSREEKYQFDTDPFSLAWSPDDRYIALITRSVHRIKASRDIGTIRLFDVATGTLSDTLAHAQPYLRTWWSGGIAWSPCGRYLVYVGYDGSVRELFALPLDPDDPVVTGTPVRLTRFGGSGSPFWPAVSRDNRFLSFNVDERNVDIYLCQLDTGSATLYGDPVPLAQDRTLDHQPCWMPDGEHIVFVSHRDGQPDLYCLHIDSRDVRRLTVSETVETDPQVTPEGDAILFYADGAIWTVPAAGGPPTRLTPTEMKVQSRYLVLPDNRGLLITQKDTVNAKRSRLVSLDAEGDRQKTLLTNLDTPDLVLAKDGQHVVVSGVLGAAERHWEHVALYDPATDSLQLLLKQPGLYPRSRLSVTPDGHAIVHDTYTPEAIRRLQMLPVDGSPPIQLSIECQVPEGDCYLGPVSPDGRHILLLMDTEESDTWVLGPEK